MELTAAALLVGFQLTSAVVPNGGNIPVRYTCDGRGTSPPLNWTSPPSAASTLMLLVSDPDAPGGLFVHWRAGKIPASAGSIGAGRHFRHEGLNSAGTRGWTPPCPPPGSSHRYRFVLTALNARGQTIAKAELVARYKRR
jgi:Raf kinase inhibitor-like YbhB/YbcL family protein